MPSPQLRPRGTIGIGRGDVVGPPQPPVRGLGGWPAGQHWPQDEACDGAQHWPLNSGVVPVGHVGRQTPPYFVSPFLQGMPVSGGGHMPVGLLGGCATRPVLSQTQMLTTPPALGGAWVPAGQVQTRLWYCPPTGLSGPAVPSTIGGGQEHAATDSPQGWKQTVFAELQMIGQPSLPAGAQPS